VEAVAQGREDYYAGEGVAPGRWRGAGAAELGLRRPVEDGQVMRLLRGRHPATGDLLGAPITAGRVAGFDLTFKAPKSVSILFGVADETVTRVLRECHETAIEDTLRYLETRACRARRGRDGTVQIEGGGFVAAAFGHRTSRAGDPLLHTHVVVVNRTLGTDGRWTALDARPLYRHAKTAGFVYQARLRLEVTERLGLEWGEVRKGAAELAGFSRELVEHFSRRRAEIVDELARRGEHSLLAAQTAALATRKGKDYNVPLERLREEWRSRAAEHGLDHERTVELLGRRATPTPPLPVDLTALTKSASTFTRRDVVQNIAAAHRSGVNVAQLEAEVDTVLACGDVARIAVPGGEARYTTAEQLRLERDLLSSARDRRDAGAARARADLTNEAIARRSLSDEQARLVRALTSSGAGVDVVRAPAGAGKTFALDAAREAWVRSSVQVTGCALSAQAAAELREQAAIDATTIARLTRAIDRGYALPYGGVLVVDEAGMVGTRDLAELVNHAAQRDAKVVLVGDDRQLPEIEAGGAFRVLAEREGALELREVRRQREPWDRQALGELRAGRVEAWARSYADADRLVTAPTAPEVRERLVDDWWQAREQGADALMVALRRRDVADLNARAREHMRDAGRLHGDEADFGGRAFSAGDRVVLGRNDRRLDVCNGDRGDVVAVAPGHIDVRLDRGDAVRVPGAYAADGHLDHGYAMTAHRVQGATVDQTFVLGSDELYREWGYTALSRHRECTSFYLTAPEPFLNRRAPEITDREQLIETVVRTFDDSRRQELAIELVERDPHAARMLHRLDNARERADAEQQRLATLREQRDRTPWYRRSARAGLDERLHVRERYVGDAAQEVDDLRSTLDEAIDRPAVNAEPQRARDPLSDQLWLERALAEPADALDHDLGLDL
jgi:Ti-type conjugative transfer relaxase TraA